MVSTVGAFAARAVARTRWTPRVRRHVALLLLVVVAGIGAVAAFVASGSSLFVVESPSMGRTAPVGTLVVTQRVRFESLHRGDVITYRPPDTDHSVTHRIVRIVPGGGVRTRGEINGAPDAWTVRPDMVVGRVSVLLPGVGWVLRLAPWVVIGVLALYGLTLPIVSPTIRSGLRLFGICVVLDVVGAVQHPLTAWSVLTETPDAGRIDAAIVGTGLLPVRLTATNGATVQAAPGEVVHLLLAPDRTGRISFDATLGLDWAGWLCVALVCLVPLMAVLGPGLPSATAGAER